MRAHGGFRGRRVVPLQRVEDVHVLVDDDVERRGVGQRRAEGMLVYTRTRADGVRPEVLEL